jgi:hypothetical protein
MAFDKSLDKELYKKELEFEYGKIVVSVMCYNEGQKKIQLSRLNKNEQDDFIFSKLGRLTKDEAVKVADAIKECVENIN